MPKTAAVAAAAGQVSLEPKELDNLLAILPTTSLEPWIRIAAADQLTLLAISHADRCRARAGGRRRRPHLLAHSAGLAEHGVAAGGVDLDVDAKV
jgi:hypothetical protein